MVGVTKYFGDCGEWDVPPHIAEWWDRLPKTKRNRPDRRYKDCREFLEFEAWMAKVDEGNWRWNVGLNGRITD